MAFSSLEGGIHPISPNNLFSGVQHITTTTTVHTTTTHLPNQYDINIDPHVQTVEQITEERIEHGGHSGSHGEGDHHIQNGHILLKSGLQNTMHPIGIDVTKGNVDHMNNDKIVVTEHHETIEQTIPAHPHSPNGRKSSIISTRVISAQHPAGLNVVPVHPHPALSHSPPHSQSARASQFAHPLSTQGHAAHLQTGTAPHLHSGTAPSVVNHPPHLMHSPLPAPQNHVQKTIMQSHIDGFDGMDVDHIFDDPHSTTTTTTKTTSKTLNGHPEGDSTARMSKSEKKALRKQNRDAKKRKGAQNHSVGGGDEMLAK